MRWIRTFAAAVVVALGLVGAVPGPACACSCVQDDIREHFARADVVFAGTLRSRDESGGKATLVFEVSEVYKGAVPARQEIVTNSSGASCGLELSGPGPHLVFGGAGSEFEPTPDEGQYVGSLCGGSRTLDATARGELKPLAKGSKPTGAAAPASAPGLPAAAWIGAGGAGALAIAATTVVLWRRRSTT